MRNGGVPTPRRSTVNLRAKVDLHHVAVAEDGFVANVGCVVCGDVV